jgi:ferredoxin
MISISRIILESDFIISIPRFKTHGLTIVSGGIKNSYGFLPGAQKARLHKAAGNPERFNIMVTEVFQIRVPDFIIVDGIVAMEGNGPASPDLRRTDLILAADNAVALDAVIATMMGCDPSRLMFLQKAKELGLGDYDLSKIEIIGDLKVIPNYKLPPLGGEAIHGNKVIEDLLYSRVILRPRVDPALCTGCGTCVGQCPVAALTMGDRFPLVEADRCITCFCCQEICPTKAITLQ